MEPEIIEMLDHVIARNTLGGGNPVKDGNDLAKVALILKRLLKSASPKAPAPTEPAPETVATPAA